MGHPTRFPLATHSYIIEDMVVYLTIAEKGCVAHHAMRSHARTRACAMHWELFEIYSLEPSILDQ